MCRESLFEPRMNADSRGWRQWDWLFVVGSSFFVAGYSLLATSFYRPVDIGRSPNVRRGSAAVFWEESAVSLGLKAASPFQRWWHSATKHRPCFFCDAG
jgi:hypothetical protein